MVVSLHFKCAKTADARLTLARTGRHVWYFISILGKNAELRAPLYGMRACIGAAAKVGVMIQNSDASFELENTRIAGATVSLRRPQGCGTALDQHRRVI